jgi:hypothetical protein
MPEYGNGVCGGAVGGHWALQSGGAAGCPEEEEGGGEHCGEQKSRTFSPRRENTNNWNKKRREK